MDSLTQILLGAAVGNAVAGKELKNKAILYGAIAGTIPDLDILATYFTDHLTAVEFHRGVTHSFIFAFLVAFPLGYFVYKKERATAISFKTSYLLMFLGLITHPILDVFTTWGTKLFWPLPTAFAFKSIFVIDPLYTIPLMVFLLLSMRETKDLKKRMRLNTYGLVLSSAYLGVSLMLKGFAYQKFTAALVDKSVEYSNLSVKPTAFNTVLWNAILETEEAFLIGEYSFFDSLPIEFKHYPKQRELAMYIEDKVLLERLITLSEGYYTFSLHDGEVFFNDLRFGLLKDDTQGQQFAFSYYFYQGEDGKYYAGEVKKDRADGVLLLKKLWNRIQGN